MNPIQCPCCRATNDLGPACRRCKADLSPLFELEARRDFLLAETRQLTNAGRYADALGHLDEAAALRQANDVPRLRAALFLLMENFPAAWAAYREAG